MAARPPYLFSRLLDDYQQASIAALCGGTTTVVDFAIPDPGQSPLAAVQERRKLAEVSRCDTALHGCVIDWDDTTADQIAAMAGLGVRTIKLFTTYRDVVMAGPDTILEVLRTLHAQRGLAYVHAEANHVIEDAQQLAAAVAHADAAHHPGTRPELAEAAAVAQVLATAEHVDAPVYFVHQTTAEAVDLVRDARRRGVRAYTETCPHYLALDAGVYDGVHPERFVCCPPLRDPATVADLRARALSATSTHSARTTAATPPRRSSSTATTSGACPTACPAWRPGCRSPTPPSSPSGACPSNASWRCSPPTRPGSTG
jgi:dihydropyrimidinase